MARRQPCAGQHADRKRELGFADRNRRLGGHAANVPNGGSAGDVQEADPGEQQNDDHAADTTHPQQL
jgi:hypothetical protein